jgi:thiamine-phosphate pyrophosphorylase
MSARSSLPALLLIGDRFTRPEIADRIRLAVSLGVHWIQLRDHDVDEHAFFEAAAQLTESLRAISPDVLISVNTHVGVAERLGCALHVGRRGPAPGEARELIPDGFPVGLSIHDESEIVGSDVDYYLFSPIYETSSKPGTRGRGESTLERVCRAAAPTPVMAMGGITPEHVISCLHSGAHGVAVRSGILQAPDLIRAVLDYRGALVTV